MRDPPGSGSRSKMTLGRERGIWSEMMLYLLFSGSSTGAMMLKHRTFIGLVIGMSLLGFSNPVKAAGKRAGQTYMGQRSVPGDSALGPRIGYPRQTMSVSSSSERYYTGGQVNALPFRSSAEALEIVPGLAVGR